jgi:uncharacterized protein YfaS (alpha-2-macroglobulin family)
MFVFRFVVFVLFVVVLGCPVAPSCAEEAFRLLETQLHADRDEPEACLVFSKPVAFDRAAVLGALSLERNGEKSAVRNVVASGNVVCVEKLAYRADYKLKLRALRSTKGEALEKPVSVSFPMPDRKAELAFVPFLEREGRMPIVVPGQPSRLTLRAMNVTGTRLSLYRLTDKGAVAGLWDQYAQAGLTALESLYFVKEHGQRVGSGEVVFSDKPNEGQSMEAPLPFAGKVEPGFYFVYAEPREAEAPSALSAGAWFVVADVAADVARVPEGVRVFVGRRSTGKPVAGAHVVAFDADKKTLADVRTGEDGAALVPLAAEASLPVVWVDAGEGGAALLDSARRVDAHAEPTRMPGRIIMDREAYRFGQQAQLVLALRDSFGAPEATAGSRLRLLRPDQSVYDETPVGSDKKGAVTARLSLPVQRKSGVWTLVWVGRRGETWAEARFGLGDDEALPKLDLAADGSGVDREGRLTVRVRARDAAGRPKTWAKGEVVARIDRPTFSGASDFTFGVGAAGDAAQGVVRASFMTDDNGEAKLALEVPWTGKEGAARAFRVTAELASGAQAQPLIVPSRAIDTWVGVRPVLGLASFAEQGKAAFDVIAVDASGRKKPVADLAFQIFEEGRHFVWEQIEGQWAANPSPEHRRVGGGAVGTNGRVIWPVVAGQYVLEITQNGNVLARLPFDAAERKRKPDAADLEAFSLKLPAGELGVGQEARLSVHVAEPAFVTLVVGDTKTRVAETRFSNAGTQDFVLTPQEGWGDALRVQAHVLYPDGRSSTRQMQINVRHPARELTLGGAWPARLTSEGIVALPLAVAPSKAGRGAATSITAMASFDQAEGDKSDDVWRAEQVVPDKAGHSVLSIPVPAGVQAVQVVVYGENEQQVGVRRAVIPVRRPLEVTTSRTGVLTVGDQPIVKVGVLNNSALAGTYQVTLAASNELKVKEGQKRKLILKPGQKTALAVPLVVTGEGVGTLTIDIAGPKGFRLSQALSWPVVRLTEAALRVTETTLGAQKTYAHAASAEPEDVLLSPRPLYGAPALLPILLRNEPYTTVELADWLEAVRLWREPLVELAGGGVSSGIDALVRRRFGLLLRRQNADGGFSARPDGESDILATAAALRELDKAGLRSAAVLAARALQRRLENMWFDEKERANRAAAFDVMFSLSPQIREAAGAGDPSLLRYFAETCRDKNVSSLAAARLALALALTNDDEASRVWLERARKTSDKKEEKARLLPLLVRHPSVDPDAELRAVGVADAQTTDFTAVLTGLRAVGRAVERAGSWHLVERGVDKKRFGVVAFRHGHAEAVQNPSRENVYVDDIGHENQTETKPTRSARSVTIQRQLLSTDGAKLGNDAVLVVGRTYALALHATRSSESGDESEPLVVTVPTEAILRPVTQADPATIEDLWPDLSVPHVEGSAPMLSERGFVFTQPAADEWRSVLLVRAVEPGQYALPPVTLRVPGGVDVPVTQNALRVRVQDY